MQHQDTQEMKMYYKHTKEMKGLLHIEYITANWYIGLVWMSLVIIKYMISSSRWITPSLVQHCKDGQGINYILACVSNETVDSNQVGINTNMFTPTQDQTLKSWSIEFYVEQYENTPQLSLSI